MSTLLKFMVPSGRQAETKPAIPSPSQSDVDLVLRRCAPIARPVDLARVLKDLGLGLAEAHKLLNRIVADETVHLKLGEADRSSVIARFRELGVAAE